MHRSLLLMVTKLVLGLLVFYNWLAPLTVGLHDRTYYCQRLCIVALFLGPERSEKDFCVFSVDHYLSKL